MEEHQKNEQLREVRILGLLKLFDKNLLAELISEDVWLDRLRRVIERNDRAGFDLMDPFTNPLWNQLSVIDDCILVDNRLAVPGQFRPAVSKRIHRGHPGKRLCLMYHTFCGGHIYKRLSSIWSRSAVNVLDTVKMLNKYIRKI